jgi:fibronectin type 3 domain-containing protein
VAGYNVYVSTTEGGAYAKLTSAPVNSTSFVDSGLQTAQTRYYVVTSVDSSNNESAFSSPVSAIVP